MTALIIPPNWKCKRIQKIVPDAADTPAEYIKKNVAGHLNHLVTKLYRRETVSGCLANVPGHLRMCEDLLCNVLLSLSKLPGLEELFCEFSNRLSLTDKLKIILFGKYTFRGKCALAVGFISQPLIFHLMRLIRV